ncbi:hypothetical protein B296_00020973 [Ensete ventricosum]|uniref:Uncharacterized protein n=1 Tax=Ensete ventricosum TaxID=4639 RepID=A0A426YC57_ENSVE|nr:hypothetical protein B296_00020973 [Ensete ventricosum]
MPWSSVGNFRLRLESIVDPCKKVESGGDPDVTPPMVKSFVPEIFIASMAYYAVVLLHTVCGPCSEACVLPAIAVACRPYPCQVGRTIVGSSMPVSGQLRCDGSIMLEI